MAVIRKSEKGHHAKKQPGKGQHKGGPRNKAPSHGVSEPTWHPKKK